MPEESNQKLKNFIQQHPLLAGQNSLFGALNEDHSVFDLFINYIKESQGGDGHIPVTVNTVGFMNHLIGSGIDQEQIDKIRGKLSYLKQQGQLLDEPLEKNTLYQFALILDELGLTNIDASRVTPFYNEILKKSMALSSANTNNTANNEVNPANSSAGNGQKKSETELKSQKNVEIEGEKTEKVDEAMPNLNDRRYYEELTAPDNLANPQTKKEGFRPIDSTGSAAEEVTNENLVPDNFTPELQLNNDELRIPQNKEVEVPQNNKQIAEEEAEDENSDISIPKSSRLQIDPVLQFGGNALRRKVPSRKRRMSGNRGKTSTQTQQQQQQQQQSQQQQEEQNYQLANAFAKHQQSQLQQRTPRKKSKKFRKIAYSVAGGGTLASTIFSGASAKAASFTLLNLAFEIIFK